MPRSLLEDRDFLLLAAALSGAVLLFDPGLPAFAAPKAALLVVLAAFALPWLPAPSLGTLAVFAGLALSPLIALDPAAALWGRSPRAEGAVVFAAVIVLALRSRYLAPADRDRLDIVLHAAGALLALSVLTGVFRVPLPGLPFGFGFGDGDGGTLGNPNTAGAVLAALLVHGAARGGGWRLLLPLYAAALFGTGSRAAWLALLGGLAWLLPAGLLRRAALGLLAAGAVTAFAAMSLRAEPAPSAALRLELWGASLRALSPHSRADDALGHWRWLIGYGPEQQAEVLERHRRPEQNAWEAGGHERVADRAHCLPLDLWLSFGLAGIAALYWMWRRIHRAAAASRAAAAAALTLLLAGLLGFFGPAEWLLLAVWLAQTQPKPAETAGSPDAIRLLLGLTLAGAMTALLVLGTPSAREHALRLTLEADYRRLTTAKASPAQLQALAERGCARAAQRPQDGEAALLCAQFALAAADWPTAQAAALRATALRPARPRAWLLRVLVDPADPQPALAGLLATLVPSALEPDTAAAASSALRAAAASHPALAAAPDYRQVQLVLAARSAPDRPGNPR